MANQQKTERSFVGLSRLRQMPDPVVESSVKAPEKVKFEHHPGLSDVVPDTQTLGMKGLQQQDAPSLPPQKPEPSVNPLNSEELAVLQRKLYQAMLYLGELLVDEKATMSDIRLRLEALKEMMPLYRSFQESLKL